MSDVKKPELSRSELATVLYAIALAYEALRKKIKRAQAAIKAGKKPRNQPSTLAMEAADYKMLHEKIDTYFKALKATEEKANG